MTEGQTQELEEHVDRLELQEAIILIKPAWNEQNRIESSYKP